MVINGLREVVSRHKHVNDGVTGRTKTSFSMLAMLADHGGGA